MAIEIIDQSPQKYGTGPGYISISSHTRNRLRFATRWVILNGIFTTQYQDGLLVNIRVGGGGVTGYNFQNIFLNSIGKQYCRIMRHFIWVFTFCQSTRLVGWFSQG